MKLQIKNIYNLLKVTKLKDLGAMVLDLLKKVLSKPKAEEDENK